MPVRRLTLGAGYFRSGTRVPADVRPAVQATLRVLVDAEPLPGPEDVVHIIPPTLRAWRRRAGASEWWVYFTVGEDGAIVVLAVAIPMY